MAACSNGCKVCYFYLTHLAQSRNKALTYIVISQKETYSGIIDLSTNDPVIVRAALRFFYQKDYTENVALHSMVLHASVYAFADIYNIPALRVLSRSNYEAEVKGGPICNPKEFAKSVTIIYQTTACDAREMRDIVVKYSADHANYLFGIPLFTNLMRDIADFSKDLAMEMNRRLQERPPSTKYKCPKCKNVWSSADKFMEGRRCPFLCCLFRSESWEQHAQTE